MTNSSTTTWFSGIKGKLLFAAVLPLVGFAISFVISLNGINKLHNIIQTAHEIIIPNFDTISEMRGSRLNYNAAITSAVDHPQTRVDKVKEAAHFLKIYRDSYERYKSNPFIEGEDTIHEAAKEDLKFTISTMEELVQLLESNSTEKHLLAKELFEKRMPEINAKIRANFNSKVSNLYKTKAASEKVVAAETEKNVLFVLAITIALSAIVIFGTLLTIAIKVSGSVGNISGQLSQSSAQVAAAVEQLTAAGGTLSSASTEAAASLEETVASLEEMSSMVKMGSDNAKQAASLATASRDSAETGAREIQNLIKSMNEISASSKKIEEIISVIDDIAFQTNLLALNAAVEAARAGEQGKGFAVVAEAVRALAQRSSSSAKDISGLIKDSVSQVENGSRIADKSGEILSNIVGSIKKVSDLNNEIASASHEQAVGIEQINKAMSQLDQAGQANAASAEEIAATSEEISQIAVSTQNLTIELNGIVFGKT